MVKVVAFFNHKGGVGKTTIVFNVAVALAEMGNNVMLFDSDSQANLTALALKEEDYEKALDDDRTIWSSLAPLVTGAGDLKPITPIKIREKLWLVPGDIRLADFEAICPSGWTEALAGEPRGFRVTSALYRLFNTLGNGKNINYVLVDLGPNVNALNRTALIGSDGFIVPLAADLFSVRALPSVGNRIANWIKQWRTAKQHKPEGIDFSIPRGEPIPLGYVSQQFSIYSSSPSIAYQKWQDKIPDAYDDGVIRPLKEAGLDLDGGTNGKLIGLPHLSSLVPTAQYVHKAIFELTGTEARGAHHRKATKTREIFVDLANSMGKRLGCT